MNRTGYLALGVAGVAIALFPARANLLVNGSFETPSGGYLYVPGGSTYLPGWLTQLNGVEIVTATDIGVGYNYPSTIQDGTQMIDLAPFIYTGGGISQTFATTPGTSYNVNFYGSSVSSFGKNGTGSILVTVDSSVKLFNLNTPSSDFVWDPLGLSFVASGTTATLTFVSLSDPYTQFAAIDNVSVTAVPEPLETSVLAGLGLAGLAGVRSFRRGKERNGSR
ncbi:MAG: DUF642 domain-containing protein [Verrucomicrobiota bacterium]